MKQCYELLRNVLLDAFNVPTIYFTPPYDDISKIDQGIRAAVWSNYNDDNTKIRFGDTSRQNRLLIIQSNLGFYNVMIFWADDLATDFISIGPFRIDELSPNYFARILKDAHITPNMIQQMKRLYENMPFVPLDALINVTRHILSSYIPEFQNVSPERIAYTDSERPIEFHTDVIEQNFLHFSEQYAEMLANFLKYLKIGESAQARNALFLFLHEAKLTTKRTMRNYKALLSALNNYCHLALLQTSIHPSYILRLAATISARIENTTSLSKLEQMPNDICHKYCLIVKNYANPEYSKLTKDVIAYIEINMEDEISLQQMAEHFGRNPSSLSTIFSRETGQTLTQFIQQTRINEALRLLNTTNMSVSEVSLAVGYQDFSYFSKLFSKHIGCSPRAYRKQNTD